MKFFIFLFIALPFFSCDTQTTNLNSATGTVSSKKYTVVLKRKEQSLVSGDYENRTKEEVITVANDSLAFWKGVTAYTAELMAQKSLRQAGVKNLPYETNEFDVLDENGLSIFGSLSESNKQKALEFIDSHR